MMHAEFMTFANYMTSLWDSWGKQSEEAMDIWRQKLCRGPSPSLEECRQAARRVYSTSERAYTRPTVAEIMAALSLVCKRSWEPTPVGVRHGYYNDCCVCHEGPAAEFQDRKFNVWHVCRRCWQNGKLPVGYAEAQA